MGAIAAIPSHVRSRSMGFRVLDAVDFDWRVTNPLGVANVNLARQLGSRDLSLRLWRLSPGQAIPRHRHQFQTELYVLLGGVGRLRVDETLMTLEPMSAVLVEPESIRQVFNDTDTESLWLITGAPPESFPIDIDDYAAERGHLYPDGVEALPPELED
jgi:quercetin dioxygenase-like cupin family protein